MKFNLHTNVKHWFLFYLIAHGGIFFILNAIYWDDWVLYRADPDSVIERFTEQAATLFYLEGYAHLALLSIGPWVYKILTFILMFGTGLILNSILKKIPAISNSDRFFIVLLFLILPLYIARVVLVDFRYTLCYFMFFLAWLLMEKHRVLAALLFFASYNSSSLLVFYALPILHTYLRMQPKGYFNFTKPFIARYWFFLLLPFAYFSFKLLYFPATGAYAGYNQNYSISNLYNAAINQYDNFVGFKVNLPLTVIASIFAYWYFFVSKYKIDIDDVRSIPVSHDNSYNLFVHRRYSPHLKIAGLSLGLSALFLAVFPYWILNHIPIFGNWDSRHQLLMPLGAALFLYSFVCYFNIQIKNLLISLLIGGSLSWNIYAYKQLFTDWQKQAATVEFFKKSSEIKNASVLFIEDKAVHFNAFHRAYNFYEWTGLLEMAFDDEARLALPLGELDNFKTGKLFDTMSYSYKSGEAEDNLHKPILFLLIEPVMPMSKKDKLLNKFYPNIKISIVKTQ